MFCNVTLYYCNIYVSSNVWDQFAQNKSLQRMMWGIPNPIHMYIIDAKLHIQRNQQ